ncbi:hypothetical protein DJ021_07040 [Phenylobacterium hankyongense]|uniref:Uncharacterized protein n=1 Tax=Phenylobacterium hankyongense TaxID=1813876 RepID=A0A328AX70_9CAUL|nr:hypothetical protein [Phenylobacterium hankyongense]RAK59573.1 hypothetical protein DJ021_07040 [Phenylobacterium hankyongense]
MKQVLLLLLGAVILALLKAVLTVLALALLLALVFSFAIRPRETLQFVGVLLVFSVASAQPTVFIITVGLVGAVVVVASTLAKRRS